MANKVLNITSTYETEEERPSSYGTYLDVSMISDPDVKRDASTESQKTIFKVQKSLDVQAVKNSLDNIFSWIPGERIINPEFGCRLYEYLYQGITDYNTEAIVSEIKNCVIKWEPRVVVDEVQNVSHVGDTEDNTVHLEIVYHIVGLEDQKYSKTYLFNRSEF